MKYKIILSSMAVFFSLGVIAQSKLSFGISAGANWNTINGKTSTGADLDNKLKTGFNGGINVELPVGTGFYLQPGVEFRRKGAEFMNGDKIAISYIDIPLTFLYKPELGNGRMLLGFGPYLGFAIGGEIKSPNGTERELVFNNTYKATQSADLQFKKLDAGANFTAGYEFANKLSASLNAQLGLMDINPDTQISGDETRYRNTGFGLSLGYRF